MTPLTFQTLRLLADGEFRSGEAMARTLGVSRASFWNALHALDGTGLEIFKVHGRGYRLSQPLVWLERGAIERALGADAGGFSIEVLDLVPSTNTLLMERVAAGAPGGSVLAAEWQTQGRGRRGRVWHATPGAALTFSLLWRFQLGASALSGLSLAVGVAVIRALDALSRPSVVRVHTDSQYVQQGISTWIHGWKRKNWRTAAGAPVKNVDLWKALDEAASRHRIEWLWVRGHAGHPGNERADALANRGVSAASGN